MGMFFGWELNLERRCHSGKGSENETDHGRGLEVSGGYYRRWLTLDKDSVRILVL